MTDIRSILVVEDEALIAMDIQAQLEDHGWNVLGPAGTAKQAITLLSMSRPHFAVLDINLGRDTSFDVADTLDREKVPFVFLSGGTSDVVPDRFKSRPMLQKPIRFDQLMSAVRQGAE